MESHYDLTDFQFEKQFGNSTFDPKLFTHEAHLRLAWIHIEKYGLEQAIQNICGQLINFTRSVGEMDKFNVSVTMAAVKIVNHFKLKSKSVEFKDFIHDNPRLMTQFKDLIASHYTTDIFTSETARKNYIEPELLPFD